MIILQFAAFIFGLLCLGTWRVNEVRRFTKLEIEEEHFEARMPEFQQFLRVFFFLIGIFGFVTCAISIYLVHPNKLGFWDKAICAFSALMGTAALTTDLFPKYKKYKRALLKHEEYKRKSGRPNETLSRAYDLRHAQTQDLYSALAMFLLVLCWTLKLFIGLFV